MRWLSITLLGSACIATFFAACGGTAVIDSEAVVVGGAGGTTATIASTVATSSTTGGTFGMCLGPGECVLTHRGCCDDCGRPELGDLDAVNASELDTYRDDQCPTQTPCDPCVGCPNGDLFAICDAGTCRGVDLSNHAFGACASDADCKLRIGTACCEPCTEVDLFCGPITAINIGSESDLRDLVCPEFGGECPPCVPTYPDPDEMVAACIDGFCRALPVD